MAGLSLRLCVLAFIAALLCSCNGAVAGPGPASEPQAQAGVLDSQPAADPRLEVVDDETTGTPPAPEEPDAGASTSAQFDAGQSTPDAGSSPPTPPPAPPFQVFFSSRPANNARDTTIENEVVRLIDLALPGSVLRLEMFTFTRAAPADALIRAHQRGVDVKLVLDGDARGATGSEIPRLEAALGAARVKSCSSAGGGTSCRGTGIMHNKVLLLSALGDGSLNVVVQASHNLTATQLTMHNNAVVIRGDAALYAAYLQTFDALATDVQNLNAYQIADGTLATRAYFFPRGSGTDTVVSILDNVTCGAGARIRVAMAFFTSGRQAIADALSARRSEGCDVAVVVGDDEIPFSATLSSAVSVTRYPQRSGGWGLHSKYLLIEAKYAGSTAARRLVFTGSHNYTGPALTSNDETLLRIEDPAVFSAFLADWGQLKAAAQTP